LKDAGDSVVQLKFDADNLKAAGDADYRSGILRTQLSAPPGQINAIGTAGGILSTQRGNPALNYAATAPFGNRGALTQSDIDGINDAAGITGAPLGLSALIQRQEQPPGGGNIFQVSPSTVPDIMKYLRTERGYTGPDLDPSTPNGSRILGMGYISMQAANPAFAGNPAAIASAYNGGPGFGAASAPYGNAVGGFASDYANVLGSPGTPANQAVTSAETQRQLQGQLDARVANLQYGSRNAAILASLPQLALGNTGAAELTQANYNDPTALGVTNAQQIGARVGGIQTGRAVDFATQIGQINQQIQAANNLAKAYAGTSEDVLKAQTDTTVYAETLSGKVSDGAQAATLKQNLLAKAYADAGQAAAEANSKAQQGIDAANYRLTLGVGNETQIDRQTAVYGFQQSAANNPAFAGNQQAQNSYVDKQTQLYDSQQQVSAVQQVQSAVNSLGQAFTSTFEKGLEGGTSFKHLLGDLAVDIGTIIEKLLIEKPLENAIGAGLGDLFGSSGSTIGGGSGGYGIFGQIFGSLFGGGSGAAAVTSAGYSGPAMIAGFSATGGTFDQAGRTRFHASGGIATTPTAFTAGDGSSNVMGEAGPEGIFPLVTLPNGNLGIQSTGGGGGGGGAMYFHTPITIQGGVGPSGQMDQGTAEQLQRQIETLSRNAVMKTLSEQTKSGGKIWRTARGQP
jgi:hypothetical protein